MSTLNSEKKQKVVSHLLREQLDKGKQLRFHVTSRSMEPFIRFGDDVVIKKVASMDIIIGDVILFEKGNAFCTHRLIHTKKKDDITHYITKGDKLIGFDVPITEDKIVGKVCAIERKKQLIDLTLLNYRMLNRSLGKIFRIQWIIYQSGKPINKFFLRKRNNIFTKLFTKILFLPFNIVYKFHNQRYILKNSLNRSKYDEPIQ